MGTSPVKVHMDVVIVTQLARSYFILKFSWLESLWKQDLNLILLNNCKLTNHLNHAPPLFLPLINNNLRASTQEKKVVQTAKAYLNLLYLKDCGWNIPSPFDGHMPTLNTVRTTTMTQLLHQKDLQHPSWMTQRIPITYKNRSHPMFIQFQIGNQHPFVRNLTPKKLAFRCVHLYSHLYFFSHQKENIEFEKKGCFYIQPNSNLLLNLLTLGVPNLISPNFRCHRMCNNRMSQFLWNQHLTD